MKGMKRRSFIAFVLPYVIFFVLFILLKLRIWILTMRLENSIPGNDSVVNVH